MPTTRPVVLDRPDARARRREPVREDVSDVALDLRLGLLARHADVLDEATSVLGPVRGVPGVVLVLAQTAGARSPAQLRERVEARQPGARRSRDGRSRRRAGASRPAGARTRTRRRAAAAASRAPQRTRAGHEIPPRSRRGSSAIIARAAVFVSACSRCAPSRPCVAPGSQRDGVRDEPRPEDRPAVPGALGVAVAETARRSGPAGSSSRRARPPARLAWRTLIPAGDTSSSPRTSSGRLCASRSATRPPNECPATRAGPGASASSTAAATAAKSAVDAPRGSRPEPAWPGRSTARTR